MRVRFPALGARRVDADVPGPTGARRASRPRGAVLAALVVGYLLPLTAPAATASTLPAPAAAPASGGGAHSAGLRPTTSRVPATHGLATARRIGAVKPGGTAVPAAVDLTSYAAAPGDQGQVSSCVGWATGYTLLGWYANYQKHAGAPFAPMYVYSQINGGRDAGATIPSAWNVLESQGVAQQSVYTQGSYDWATRPTAAETANAGQHKTRSHTYLFAGDNQGAAAQTALQAALASNQPAIIGIPVHSGFGSLSTANQVWRLSDTVGKGLLGYHALVAVGYDSTGLRIENSWGKYWGAAGFATLGWDFVNRYMIEASVGTGFVTTDQPVPPKVSQLSRTTISSRGGETLTVTGTQMSTVGKTAAGAARLVNAADPALTAALTVTAQTATTLTVTTSAVPAATDGKPVQGAYRVVLTGSGGTSAATDPAAGVTVVTPYAISVAAGTLVSAAGGTALALAGADFGTTTALFARNQVTATVNGRSAAVTWVSDTRVAVAVPAGVPGGQVAVILLRGGVPGGADSTARYAAVITASTQNAGPSSGGWLTVLTGVGFAKSGNWALVDSTGAVAATLPVVTTRDALTAAGSGVLLASGTQATVKLPAAPSGRPGVYSLTFTPDQAATPGAAAALTSKAYVVYTDIG